MLSQLVILDIGLEHPVTHSLLNDQKWLYVPFISESDGCQTDQLLYDCSKKFKGVSVWLETRRLEIQLVMDDSLMWERGHPVET